VAVAERAERAAIRSDERESEGRRRADAAHSHPLFHSDTNTHSRAHSYEHNSNSKEGGESMATRSAMAIIRAHPQRAACRVIGQPAVGHANGQRDKGSRMS